MQTEKHTRQVRVRGFTIVELMIVIAVIAILAAITVVAYTNIQERAQTTARISAARQALSVIQLYQADNGDLPEIPIRPGYNNNVRAACLGEGWPQASNGENVCWNIMRDGSVDTSTFYQFNEINAAFEEYGQLPSWPQEVVASYETSERNALILYWRNNTQESWPEGYSLGWIQAPHTSCGISGAIESGGDAWRRCVVPL